MGIPLRPVLTAAALVLACLTQADTLPRRGALGVAFLPVPGDIAKKDNLKSGRGALVGNVLPGLTGEGAGLKQGDVLLDVSGRPVKGPALGELVRSLTPGANVVFRVIRDGRPMTLSAPLTEKPRDPGNEHYSVEYSFV